ncbi:hypothetical protein GALL_342850 [mine drainage metagenome]|jgi:hypothetical protein|uniref:DUF4126 domain-containing protein n=1 Tax=mine drainage metagenome TaxID=410659 RepID=A0A1J5QVL9_9ZZZZ
MDAATLQGIALAAALGWASGLRAALVVFALGAAGLGGWITLPAQLAWLASPPVVGLSSLLAFAGFIADKIPGVDSLSDFAAASLRVVTGALLAAAIAGGDHALGATLALSVGGLLAAASTLTKLAVRAAINTTPEPFSNIGASLAEEIAVFGSIWLAWSHPLAWLLLLVALLFGMAWLLRVSARHVRTMLGRLVRVFSGRAERKSEPTAAPTPAPKPAAAPHSAIADITDVHVVGDSVPPKTNR